MGEHNIKQEQTDSSTHIKKLLLQIYYVAV